MVGTPCAAAAMTFGVAVATAHFSMPALHDQLAFFALLNGVIAFGGSAAGGLLLRGSVAARVLAALIAAIFGCFFYGLMALWSLAITGWLT